MSEFNNTLSQKNEEEIENKPQRKKSVKPPKFAEQKKMTELILNAEGKAYEEWLHEKHTEFVQDKLPKILPTLLQK